MTHYVPGIVCVRYSLPLLLLSLLYQGPLIRATPGKLIWKPHQGKSPPPQLLLPTLHTFSVSGRSSVDMFIDCLMCSWETEQALSVWFSNQGFSSHSNIFASNNDPTGRSWLVTWPDARDTWNNPGSCVLLVTQAILWARTRVPILRFLLLGSQGVSVWSQIQGPVLSILCRQILMPYPEAGAENISYACFTKRQL